MSEQPSPVEGSLWLHRSSGGIYVVDGSCQLEAENVEVVQPIATALSVRQPADEG
jgi:hypothetical protein